MIENGYWKVDADGIVGGIEKFEEADSVKHCNLYFIDTVWGWKEPDRMTEKAASLLSKIKSILN